MSLLDQIVFGYVPTTNEGSEIPDAAKNGTEEGSETRTADANEGAEDGTQVVPESDLETEKEVQQWQDSMQLSPIVPTLPYNVVASNFNSESKVTCPCLETGTVDASIDNDSQANSSNLLLLMGPVTACTNGSVPQASSFVMLPERAIAHGRSDNISIGHQYSLPRDLYVGLCTLI